jgi:DNA polymerase III gamma/tau subunit
LDVLIDALLQFDGVKALQELELVYQEGHDLLQFNKNLLENLRKRLLQSVGGAPQITARLLKLIDLLRESYVNSKHAVIPQLPLEMAIIEGCLMVDAPVAAPQALASNISPTVTTQAVEAPSKATVQPVDQSPKAAATPVQPVARDAEPARDHQGLQPAEMKDLNFDQVKELWPQVLQQVKSSILKKTLPLGQILKVEGPTIFLGFTTNFHLSKVMEQTQRIELENVIEQLVGSQVKISAEIKDFGGIKKTAVASGLNSVPVEAVDEDTEKVLDMFGGEVM